jgi:hypothetical protein
MSIFSEYKEALFHGNHSPPDGHVHVGEDTYPLNPAGGASVQEQSVPLQQGPSQVSSGGGGTSEDYRNASLDQGIVYTEDQLPGGGQMQRAPDGTPLYYVVPTGTNTVAIYRPSSVGPDGRPLWSASSGPASYFDPLEPEGPAGPTGEANLEQILQQPGVIGHEFAGRQLIVYLNNGRSETYNDTDGDGSFKYGTNTGQQPGPGFVPLGGQVSEGLATAPGLASLDDNLFGGSSASGLLEGRLDYFNNTPDTPVSEGQALTDVLRRGNPLSVSNTTTGVRDPFGMMQPSSQEDVARTYLQGQTPQNFLGDSPGSRDQSVLRAFGVSGLSSYDDPLQASALSQQLRQQQIKYQNELGLDPIAAANMVKSLYGQ